MAHLSGNLLLTLQVVVAHRVTVLTLVIREVSKILHPVKLFVPTYVFRSANFEHQQFLSRSHEAAVTTRRYSISWFKVNSATGSGKQA